MRRLTIALFASLAFIAVPVSAGATTCKDAKGKFTKCPPAASVKKATVKHEAKAAKTEAKAASKMAAKKSAAPASVMAPKKTGPMQRCRNSKGQFAKCGTSGAKPA